MKQWYDGWETTDKLAEAGIKFENDFPYRNMYVEALGMFLQKEGYYSPEEDDEVSVSLNGSIA